MIPVDTRSGMRALVTRALRDSAARRQALCADALSSQMPPRTSETVMIVSSRKGEARIVSMAARLRSLPMIQFSQIRPQMKVTIEYCVQ